MSHRSRYDGLCLRCVSHRCLIKLQVLREQVRRKAGYITEWAASDYPGESRERRPPSLRASFSASHDSVPWQPYKLPYTGGRSRPPLLHIHFTHIFTFLAEPVTHDWIEALGLPLLAHRPAAIYFTWVLYFSPSLFTLPSAQSVPGTPDRDDAPCFYRAHRRMRKFFCTSPYLYKTLTSIHYFVVSR